jgi:D-sedoheptulose 7-phosphate isomerase
MTPEFISSYQEELTRAMRVHDWSDVAHLADALAAAWRDDRQVFLCGNGGSAANAMHLANDFIYGIDKSGGRGLRATALPANSAVVTCLANDLAYAEIFARQLATLARAGDVLIVLSGSGNSPNVVRALEQARDLGLTSFAIVGYSGGRCRELANDSIHFAVDDMQVAEDLQMIVGHMVMQWLSRNRPDFGS